MVVLCVVVFFQPLTSEAQTWPDEPNYPNIIEQEAREYAYREYGPLNDREQAAVKWAMEFQPSVLTLKEQIDELMWFAHNADDLRGTDISSVAETLKTHSWESKVLADAFTEITGIDVNHNIIGEGSLVEKLQTQLSSGRSIYDIYVTDADLIGMHLRLGSAVNLTDYMNGEGSQYTNPTLDLGDWMNAEFGQNYDGDQIQLPDQQFANLYWFRYDWFTDPNLKRQFRNEYGYELGVPRNWAAYEDIAEFFTESVSPSDVGAEAEGIYGHMDYGKKSPSLGWRFTDAWFSIAGVGDTGLPNGNPVAEWGIRVEDRIPVGATVDRGGATNSPAAYYATQKYLDWMEDYAPPFATSMRWSEAGPVPSRGNIAQRVFQYITFLSTDPFTSPESAVTDDQGNPKWRMAPTPRGRYWDEGMKVGYQDAGSWTIPTQTTGDKRHAAWVWAQFASSKTVSLNKFNVGNTPVRRSTVNSEYWEKHEGELGGLITFYTSPVEDKWTDTGKNVPHYPLLAEQWWKQVAQAVTGEKTVKQALDDLAAVQNSLMQRLRMQNYSPQLNPERSRAYWLNQPGAPKAERPPEDPVTVPYDELIQEWADADDKPSLTTNRSERAPHEKGSSLSEMEHESETSQKQLDPDRVPETSATVDFAEPSGNNRLDGGETATVGVTVKNTGSGPAREVQAEVVPGRHPNLSYPSTVSFGTIEAGASATEKIGIQASRQVSSDAVRLTVQFEEARGFAPSPIRLQFETQQFIPPELTIADVGINDGNGNGTIEPGELVEVTMRIRNTSRGRAEDVAAEINLGENLLVTSDTRQSFDLGTLGPGEYQDATFKFVVNQQAESIPVTVDLLEKHGKFGKESIELPLALDRSTDQIAEVQVEGQETDVAMQTGERLSVDVETNIPTTPMDRPDAVAVVIGVQSYASEGVPDVEYARRDARFVRKYLTQTLGFHEENILPLTPDGRVTYAELRTLIRQKLPSYVKEGTSEVFVYYSGHGAPSTGEDRYAYLVPSDTDPNFVSDDNAYRLSQFYEDLAALDAASVTVVLDACFTGQSGSGDMMLRQASPLALSVENPLLGVENATGFLAAGPEQVANWYPEKKHGMFTYFFLKGLKGEADLDDDRKVMVREMKQYLTNESRGVPYWSRRVHRRKQVPQVVGSATDHALVRYE